MENKINRFKALMTFIKKYLHVIPLIILIYYAIRLIIDLKERDLIIQDQHTFALIFLIASIIIFFIRYKYGILFLGFTLIVGLVGLISLSPSLYMFFIKIGLRIWFSPFFLLVLIIHASISWKYYYGIGTAEYWRKMLQKDHSAE